MEEQKMTIYKITLIKKLTDWEFEKTEIFCTKLQWFSNDDGQRFVICHYRDGKQHTFLLDQFDIYQYEELSI